MSYRLTFVLFCFFPNTFIEAKALHLRSIVLRCAGAPTTKKCFFLFPFCLFWRCRFFPSIFCTIAIFPRVGPRKKTRLNENIHHHLEGKNVRLTLHTKRKWQWYKKYLEKSDISKINKRGKGRNTFWLSGRPHIEERLNEGEAPLLQ